MTGYRRFLRDLLKKIRLFDLGGVGQVQVVFGRDARHFAVVDVGVILILGIEGVVDRFFLACLGDVFVGGDVGVEL